MACRPHPLPLPPTPPPPPPPAVSTNHGDLGLSALPLSGAASGALLATGAWGTPPLGAALRLNSTVSENCVPTTAHVIPRARRPEPSVLVCGPETGYLASPLGLQGLPWGPDPRPCPRQPSLPW